MKRYHVITRTIGVGEHLNVEELMPAPCTYITGVFATAFGKKNIDKETYQQVLAFPYSVLKESIEQRLKNLFYSYMRSRSTQEEAQAYFELEMLSAYSEALSVANFSKYSEVDNVRINSRVNDALIGQNAFEGSTTLSQYLFDDHKIFESTLKDDDFIALLLKLSLQFLYDLRESIFYIDAEHYTQPKDIEVGNVTLLINGNNFILRDYAVVANRKLKPIEKEVIPFNEPLAVNSSLKVVFKNTQSEVDMIEDITVKIYIQYEYQRATT